MNTFTVEGPDAHKLFEDTPKTTTPTTPFVTPHTSDSVWVEVITHSVSPYPSRLRRDMSVTGSSTDRVERHQLTINT